MKHPQQQTVQSKNLKLDNFSPSVNLDYSKIPNLALEAIEKLSRIKPLTIGQASRVSGINPVGIEILLDLKNK